MLLESCVVFLVLKTRVLLPQEILKSDNKAVGSTAHTSAVCDCCFFGASIQQMDVKSAKQRRFLSCDKQRSRVEEVAAVHESAVVRKCAVVHP